MLQVDKETNVLDDKKQAVVTTPLSEKKLLTTGKVTTSDEAHKHNDNITISEEVVEGTDEGNKLTDIVPSARWNLLPPGTLTHRAYTAT